MPTLRIGRREFLAGWCLAAGLNYVRPLPALGTPGTITTPAQTEGPFYPSDWNGDIDNDLIKVQGEAARAEGQVLHLLGRILDMSSRPVPGAKVEIWQCDSRGIYRHPRDEGAARMRDTGFQGRGRTVAGQDGGYRFRTLRPVAYSGRTPHIHFRIAPPAGPPLVTQMYVFGERRNARDGVLNAIRDPRQRDSVIVRLDPAENIEAGALAGTFDIVIG